jgi:hypothetical protein
VNDVRNFIQNEEFERIASNYYDRLHNSIYAWSFALLRVFPKFFSINVNRKNFTINFLSNHADRNVKTLLLEIVTELILEHAFEFEHIELRCIRGEYLQDGTLTNFVRAVDVSPIVYLTGLRFFHAILRHNGRHEDMNYVHRVLLRLARDSLTDLEVGFVNVSIPESIVSDWSSVMEMCHLQHFAFSGSRNCVKQILLGMSRNRTVQFDEESFQTFHSVRLTNYESLLLDFEDLVPALVRFGESPKYEFSISGVDTVSCTKDRLAAFNFLSLLLYENAEENITESDLLLIPSLFIHDHICMKPLMRKY